MASYLRGTVAEIDLAAIQHNARVFRQQVGNRVGVMGVVKADAYGHGAVPVARALRDAGVDWLGVATAEEGEELRQAGIGGPVLVLGPSNREQLRLAVERRLDVILVDEAGWRDLNAVLEQGDCRPRVHLKVDTGMGRVGVPPESVVPEWLPRLTGGSVEWVGLMSHFAESDAEDSGFTRQQLSTFLDVIEAVREAGVALPSHLHLANSAATLRYPGTHFSLVRVGIGLYGSEPWSVTYGLRPAMRLVSRVTMVKRVGPGQPIGYGRAYVTTRPTVIATVAVGYADGYPRSFSNVGWVLIQGQRCPVVGRVSMDQTTVAVPDGLAVRPGERVTLMGQDGEDEISAHDWAQWSGTISYEVLTRIGSRVPREYVSQVRR
ncbi:MAG: alanine racemase [Firmicutes bacterium]|nr:alanine racemase [Bacillota bacterium]